MVINSVLLVTCNTDFLAVTDQGVQDVAELSRDDADSGSQPHLCPSPSHMPSTALSDDPTVINYKTTCSKFTPNYDANHSAQSE